MSELDPNAEVEEIETDEIDESIAADIDAAWEEHEAEKSGTDDGSEEDDDPTSGTEPESEEEDAEDAIAPETQAKDEPSDKPPAGLGAAAREAWKTADPALKSEIQKREKDYAVGLQKNAEAANQFRQMDKTLARFQPYLSANGGAQAIVDLLQYGTQLQLGSAQQKATAIAQVIKQFGVDINTLDDVLSGEMPRQQQQAPRLSENEQWLQQFRQQHEQQQYYQQQQAQQEVTQSVEQFMNDPKNEFADLVREEMAVMLKSAAEMGRSMTMEQAYTTACQMRPDISPILAARNSSNNVRNARRASSSISGAPGGSTVKSAPDSIASALEAAWDSQGQL